MSYHRYNKSCCEVIWSLWLHEHLQGRYWRWVILILAMFHFQVLWNRLRKPELVPLARKVDFWNWYGIFSIFRRSIWLLFMNRCFEAQIWYVNVDIARSVRIIKQCNAIVFMQAVRVGELTNHSGYLNIMKTCEILMLLKGSPTKKIRGLYYFQKLNFL